MCPERPFPECQRGRAATSQGPLHQGGRADGGAGSGVGGQGRAAVIARRWRQTGGTVAA